MSATEKLASFLIARARLSAVAGSCIELPMTRQDIGEYLGLTIETVSRTFSKFKEKGIIRLPSLRCVEIVKWDALQYMSE
jgi:CRP/FNR family transcriptional regulator, nitrogen fixation regulation protein